MEFSVKHGLSDLAQVKHVVEQALASYAEKLAKYEPAITWQGENRAQVSFTVMQKTLDAVFAFDESELRFEGKVPLLFRPFQAKIESVLTREIDHWLGKARSGELT